ncbi:MAG: hypothetical protein LBC09_03125, partial [Helicobacteraceae bacterium]|nr:hypothetical protein [Helicobacteraceae bacterium]
MSFTLTGCDIAGGGGGDSGEESAVTDGETPIATESVYTVGFYDDNLNQIAKEEYSPLELINVSNRCLGPCYKGGALVSTDYHLVNGAINFYAAPSVHEIRNEIDLNDTRNNLAGRHILLNDITLTQATLDPDYGWTPIGTSGASFLGLFSGDGYKISGIWIDRP